MEEFTTDSGASELVTSKFEVLAIGDQLPRNPNKKKRPKRNFNADFTKRLGQLVMGDPNASADENFLMDQMELNIIKVDELTQHYVFSINTIKTTGNCFPYACTIDAKSLFRATKIKLSNEKWISGNIIERIFDNKDTNHYKIDNVVYEAKGNSFDEQDKLIFNYICFLQQEFRKERKL